jgi:biotin carboxyl carrier protein
MLLISQNKKVSQILPKSTEFLRSEQASDPLNTKTKLEMTKGKSSISSETGKKNPAVIDCEKMNCRELNLEGTVYKTHFTKKFELKKKWVPPDPGKIISFIPGTILKVLVKPGDELKAGDDMLILEAMKMQNRVKTVNAVKIKEVHVKEGDKIPKGFLMFEVI